MKRSKLLLTLMLMLALLTCLLSVPVLSGENPWDADGGGNGGTSNPMDTSQVIDAGQLANLQLHQAPVIPHDDNPSWFEQTLFRASTYLMNLYYKWSSNPAQKTRYAY